MSQDPATAEFAVLAPSPPGLAAAPLNLLAHWSRLAQRFPMAEQSSAARGRVHWIGGWGVMPESLHAVATQVAPDATHTCLAPTSGAVEELPPCDMLVGWSLGAWRVLDAAARGMTLPERVILLAPFVAFAAEYQLGGRSSVTQVRFLHRWVKRDPIAALKDFHARTGLGAGPASLPYAVEDLLEGLDQLAGDASPSMRQFAAAGLRPGWTAVVGRADPLLDAEVIAKTLPGTIIAPNAGHDAGSLAAAVRSSFHAV